MTTTSAARFIYGWLIVLIACCTMLVSAGTFVTFGQFIGPLSQGRFPENCVIL